MFAAAAAAAEAAGVTRLADITRLDRIGLHVWQAVRPMSRALSVHQGKGATSADAKIGALLEGVESDAAERFAECSINCSFDELDPQVRAPTIADFAADRDHPPSPSEPVGWVAGDPLPGCRNVLLPLPLVALDFTGDAMLFDRTSNGIGTASTRDEAIMVALHELIERDSVIEWRDGRISKRIASTIEPDSVPFDWFHELTARIEAAGADLACYRVPSLTGTPVVACEINDSSKGARPFRATVGHAAHPLPEIALFKAVSEACQSRAAFIAGARDDLYPWLYSERETAITIAFGMPVPPGMTATDFASIGRGPDTLPALCSALVEAGYPDATAVTLATPPGLSVVRAFACGLGSMTRRRRPVVY